MAKDEMGSRPAPFMVSPRKAMAMGQGMPEAGNFGAEPLEGGIGHRDADMKHEPMSDGNRAVGKGVPAGRNKMPAQRHPDHGPHHSHKERG